MSIISNSSCIVNSFVSLLRCYHFSFSVIPYTQKDYIGKKRADETGEQENRGQGDGERDGAEMKTGDY